jgi:DNA sulfur modification protein DndB
MSANKVSYIFPATMGTQAGKDFYTATIPFSHLVQLFRFDEETVPAELRAQRALNETRARAISDYILTNPDSYVLPAITASCDTSMTFKPLDAEYGVGLLKIVLGSCLLINDGQHRRKGIELALQENPALADHCVSVTLFYDQGLHASQQMFSDINSNANKPSGSLNALYDLRNPFSRWIISILDQRPAIKNRIDMESAAPAKSSSKLWSLVAFHQFVNHLTGVNAKNIKSLSSLDGKTEEVVFFLDALEAIPMWSAMIKGNISAPETREQYIISHAVFLHALGTMGSYVKDLNQLKGLADIDPAKSSPLWDNRAIVHGKLRKTPIGVKSTAAVLLKKCGIELPADLAEIDALCDGGAA